MDNNAPKTRLDINTNKLANTIIDELSLLSESDHDNDTAALVGIIDGMHVHILVTKSDHEIEAPENHHPICIRKAS